MTRNGDWFEADIVFPGLAEHVRTARDFTGRVLDGHPCADTSVQLVSETVPELRETGDLQDEGGRGLRLVAAMSDHWGFQLREDGCVTWFLLGR